MTAGSTRCRRPDETLGLFYNKTLFDKNGWQAPKTIAELETLAEAMKAKGLVPFAAGNADWRPTNEHYVSIVLNSIAGPDNVYKALTGEIPWTSEPLRQGDRYAERLVAEGLFRPELLLAHRRAGLRADRHRPGGRHGADRHLELPNVPRYFPQNNAEPAFVGPSAEGVPSPTYALGIGSTFSIAESSENPDGAAAVIDYVFSDKFYGDINTVWQGEWNTPLKDLSKVTIGADVLPLYGDTTKALADAVGKNQYGYTTWTFPAAGDRHLSRLRHGGGLARQDHDGPVPREARRDLQGREGRRQGSGHPGAVIRRRRTSTR